MSNSKQTKGSGEQDWYLPEESREHLRQLFTGMAEPVALEVYTKEGENDAYNEAMTLFMRDVGRLGEKIDVSFHELGGAEASRRKVTRSPTLLIAPDSYSIRYTGAPLGEEARIFIETLMLASRGKSGLSEISRNVLSELEEPRNVKVFISPT